MAAASRVPPVDDEVVGATARTATLGAGGTLVFERSRLRAASDTVLRRLIGAALACAGGQAGPPRGRRLAALITRLNTAESFVATLGGAKIVAGDQLHFVRDAGEARRGGLAPLSIGAGQSAVWDGRFEIIAGAAPVTVGALAGRMKRLPKGEQILLRTMDSAIRPALPMIESDGLPPTCPILAKTDRARTNPLVGMRFLAACGVISKEAAT